MAQEHSTIYQPKVLKLYIPGEAIERTEVFVTESGDILTYNVKRKLLVPSKKNQKQIVTNPRSGRSYIIGSKHYLKWQKDNEDVFRRFFEDTYNKSINLPIVRCKAKCLFYFPDSKDRDLTNKFDTIADELTAHGIILDDTFKVMKPVYVDGWVCRNKPRTELYLTIIPNTSSEYDWDITSSQYYEDQKKKRAIKARIKRIGTKEGLQEEDS